MSFRITLSPSKRAAGRFIEKVRRTLLAALAEEEAKSGLTQADIARTIGVNRSVIHRELRGHKDITMGRVAELASAMGRTPKLSLPQKSAPTGNIAKDSVSVATNGGANDNGYRVERAYM